MQQDTTKLPYIYAVCNKRTGKIINRKSRGNNPFYTRKRDAENKTYDDEIVGTFKLVKINEKD